MSNILHDSINDFMGLSKEERRSKALEGLWGNVETAVEEIALERRNAEVGFAISPEEFDKKLNEICEAAYEKFASMTQDQLAGYMLMKLLECTFE